MMRFREFFLAISCPTQHTFTMKKAKSTFLLERTRDSIFYGEKNHSSKEIGHHADAL